jgi:hypothetical protein
MMNEINGKISIKGKDKGARRPANFAVWLAVALLFITVKNSEATVVAISVPNVGTTISYMQDFTVLNPLEGAILNGQTQSVNIFFTNNNFLVAAGLSSFTVDLFINQSGPIGAWPTNGYCVTGYLIDAAGNPLSSEICFPDSGTFPEQSWVGWPFYLPNGTEYLPATKMFESQFAGTPIYGDSAGYFVNPIIFSGVHFDIKYPNSPTNEVLGGRIVIANFTDPIFNSPNPVPNYSQYFVNIPQPTLGVTGLASLGSGGTGATKALNLQLLGTPNYPYVLESATNLVFPAWTPVTTNSAGTNGVWNITVTNLQGIPLEYFRVVAWPGQ